MANQKWQDALGNYIGGIYPVGVHATAFVDLLNELRLTYEFSDVGDLTILRTITLVHEIRKTYDGLYTKCKNAEDLFPLFDRATNTMEAISSHQATRPLPPVAHAISALRWEKAVIEQEAYDASQRLEHFDARWDQLQDPLRDLMYETPIMKNRIR